MRQMKRRSNPRWLYAPLAVFALVAAFLQPTTVPSAEAATTYDPTNSLAETPPMGWNSYNIFGGTFFPSMADCSLPSCIPLNETRVKAVANAMISSGLRDKGYVYINIDDRWQDPRVPRGTDGRLRWDDRRFPSGMPALADWLHDRGLKLGLYVLPNERPCGGEEGPTTKPGWPSGLPETGSMGHETTDAQTFADWEVDYLKFDWCGNIEAGRYGQAAQVFEDWNDAINASGRDMLVAASTWGWENESTWGPNFAHTWRIDGDVLPNFTDTLRTLDAGSTSTLRTASGPSKGWNDFDTMQVGNPGLTDAEGRTQFIMWAMSNSPLILGNDVSTASTSFLDLVGNPEIIDVNQDPLGEQAWLAQDTGGLQVWSRSLSDGSKAIALLNRTSSDANITADFSSVFLGSTVGSVRNLVDRSDAGVFSGSYTANVSSHDTVLLNIRPATVVEAESGTRVAPAAVQTCTTCSGGQNVGYVGNNAGTLTLSANVASGGSYDLTLFYNSGDTRSVNVSVNGGAPTTMSDLNSGSWAAVATATVATALTAGANSIQFSAPGGVFSPDLDRITLTKRP